MSTSRILLATLALALATPAAAQDVTLSWGATLTSNYISRGVTQTENRPAFQPWAEVGFGGFYTNIWASNVRFPDEDDRVEVDLSAGYRFSLGDAAFDVGYARYFYDRSGNCCGELYGLVEIATGSGAAFGGLHLDPSDGLSLTNAHVGVRLTVMEPLSASALVGRADGSNYGNLGLTYAVTPNVELDLRYHRGTDNRLVVSAGISF